MKYKGKIWIQLTYFIFCITNSTLAQTIIALDEDKSDRCVTVKIQESTSTNYKARIKVHKIKQKTEDVVFEKYQHLLFDDTYTLQNVGEPELPVIVQHIGLPSGCTYKAEIIEQKWETIPIGKIYPAQIPLTTNYTTHTFVISDEIYKSKQYHCDLIKSSGIMIWKGIENVYLTICPFKYYPSKNMLSVLSDFTLSISFSHDTKKDICNYIEPEAIDTKMFDNKDFLIRNKRNIKSSHSKTSSSINSDYLIIVGNIPEIENSQAMKDFRKWKALKGYKTKMVSTSTIGSDSASIKDYIAQQYLLGIRRVLFIGTQEKIPIPTFPARIDQSDHHIVKSDYWYGCLNGTADNQCDLPISRFVTNSLSDFTNVVDKTIKYESQYHEWANRVLLVSYEQHYPSFQAPLDTIYDKYNQILNINKAFAASVSNGGNGATILDVIDCINDGTNIVTVNAHGDATGFWLFMANNNILIYANTGLLNSDTYPIFFSNACSNGDFTSNNSIMKSFMCSDHCSSAWIGCSVPSFINAQNQLTQILYSKLLNNDLWTLGNLLLESHVANLGYGDEAIDNAFSFIYGGDPTLEIWTGNQNVFENVNISTLGNNLNITVSNANNYNINISTENGELIGKYNTNSYNISIPLSNGKFDLAICKHNYVPYVVHIDTESQYIQNKTITGNSYYGATPISLGYNVTSSMPYGNVVIESGAKTIIRRGTGVTINSGFECKAGGELIIK